MRIRHLQLQSTRYPTNPLPCCEIERLERKLTMIVIVVTKIRFNKYYCLFQ